jgi:hypothetical protein
MTRSGFHSEIHAGILSSESFIRLKGPKQETHKRKITLFSKVLFQLLINYSSNILYIVHYIRDIRYTRRFGDWFYNHLRVIGCRNTGAL